MKQSTLDVICCPACKTSLSYVSKDGSEQNANGEVLCSTCGQSYPIENGIVHFIDAGSLEGQNKHFSRYYNRLSPWYSLFTRLAFLPFGGDRKARHEILKHLDLKGGRILEVSIGNGVNLPYLYEMPGVDEIFGIDISIGQLSQCQKLVHRRGWRVDLSLAMAESLPFKDDVFDDVLHIGGINFFSNKQQSIDEMIRVVRPGGKIVIADEEERLAKLVNRSFISASRVQDGKTIETTILNLIPTSMQAINMHGIWKVHGRFHGYCIEFQKPG